MDEPLFRPEVIEAKRNGWLGGISLAQPVRLWVLAAGVAAAAVAIGVFLAKGEYTRRSHVVGQLVPDLGLSTVVAPTAGIVDRIYPREGDRVLAGASLVLVAAPRATGSGTDARSAIAEGIARRRASLRSGAHSQAVMLDARESGLRTQLAAMHEELARVRQQLSNRGRQVALARRTLERYRALQRQRYLSDLQVTEQEQSLLELVSGRQALQRQLASLQRERAQLEQSLAEIPAQRIAQQSATARDLALLDREQVQNDANGELLVEAPVAGLVASRLIEPGQSVQAGQPLLSLLPAGSHLQARLFVPSRAVGFIEPGDHVLLRYQAFPYQKFGHHEGVVSRVSRSAVSPAGGEPGEPYYRVLVDIDHQSITAYGRQEPLRPGMVLEADIMGERRKLYEWVLEPLYSVTGKI
jgi:membrane fusion protein